MKVWDIAKLLAKKFNQHRIQYGLQSAARVSLGLLLPGNQKRKMTLSGIDVSGFYSFIKKSEIKSSVHVNGESTDKTVTWVIPDFGIGSGGHLNIFRFMKGLEDAGWNCQVVIDGPCKFSSAEEAKKVIVEHFFPVAAKVYIGLGAAPACQFIFATSWVTAYTVRNYVNAIHKLYFVQDFEPYFYPKGFESELAEQTYKFGFTAVTAGSWISQKLKADYGMDAYPVGFSYDRETYFQNRKSADGIKRILFYARPPTPRRAFEMGLMALEYVAQRCDNVEFVFAGWDISSYKVDYPHLNLGVLSLDKLPELYNSVDVALVLSFTNLSLLPLELMACGCAVVSNRGDNVEWLLGEHNSVLVEPQLEIIGEAIIELLDDEDKRQCLVANALDFSSDTNWQNEINKLVAVLEGIEPDDKAVAVGRAVVDG